MNGSDAALNLDGVVSAAAATKVRCILTVHGNGAKSLFNINLVFVTAADNGNVGFANAEFKLYKMVDGSAVYYSADALISFGESPFG